MSRDLYYIFYGVGVSMWKAIQLWVANGYSCTWFVSKVSVLIFLCTNWQSSTSLMYIGVLVVILAACPYLFQLDWLSQSCATAVCVWTDTADDWVLHHDNAPAHTALSIWEFLVKKNIPVLPHPPYIPDLALCDFYLFSKLKLKLKGHHFVTMENITDELHTLTENDFRYCYDQWEKRWNHCVTSQGSYFEGDNL